jgi:phosphotransferase system HPr (HPr) family protein
MVERTVVAGHPLHARPASLLIHVAREYEASVKLVAGEREADASSILAVMTLDVGTGDTVSVRAEGPDAAAAVEAVVERLTRGEAHD